MSEEAEKKVVHQQEDLAAGNAKSIVARLGLLANKLKSAELMPEEVISIGGKSVACFVVRFADDKDNFKTRKAALDRESTIWIDKSQRVIVKKVERSQPLTTLNSSGQVRSTTEIVVTYPVVELDRSSPCNFVHFSLFRPPMRSWWRHSQIRSTQELGLN